MIKAICFDLDGVYFTQESFLKFKKAIGINSTEEKTNFVFHKSEQISDFKKGLIGENDFWNFVRKELNLTLKNEEIFEFLRDSYSVDENVKKTVEKVKGLGLKACICTNNFETRIRELDNKFNFLKDFEVKIISHEVGVMKPDIKIFEELIRNTKVEPNEIVYSDDTAEKLEGANKLGINTFVYEGFDKFVEKLQEFGVKI
ncbi:HAD-IA family hydrolase [Candidatus Dojkabacteria bacterium]|nr:HAD-IA family hydrolase [Candidatus Dojkabacteria bacterium]